MKKTITLLIIFVFLAFSVPFLAFADGGMVIWPRDINLSQSAQNAIVAWNGEEEIIILSNNIESDFKGTALRMVPLPSNPSEIKEGSFDSFEKITQIVNEKIREKRQMFHLGEDMIAPEVDLPGVEIVFHEQVGAHDLTIVKVNNLDDFIVWVESFAQEKGFQATEEIDCSQYSFSNCPEGCQRMCVASYCDPEPPFTCTPDCGGPGSCYGKAEVHKVSQKFREGIENYLKRDINYFVFDVIDTNQGEESINPLIYRFDSDYLYYPVLISGVSEVSDSMSEIKVFFVTENDISPGNQWRPYSQGRFGHSVKLSQEELNEVSEDIASLFDSEVKVITFDSRSLLSKLDKDLIFYPEIWQRNLGIGSQGKDVKALQKILINEGFWGSEAGATGYFGQFTANALTKLQERNANIILKPFGLERGTGFFGTKTRETLESSLSLFIEQVVEEAQFLRNLYLGSKGDDVKLLQEILIKEGLWESPNIGATGYFGPITRRAVVKFQQRNASEVLTPLGLTNPTGFVGPSTRSYLNKIK